MAAKSVLDFGSQVSLKVVESAANTLTFQRIEGGVVSMAKVGWVLQRIQFFASNPTLFNSSSDSVTLALTLSNKIVDLEADNPGVIYSKQFMRVDFGTAATGLIWEMDVETDMSGLQGGGILMLPNPLYLAVLGNGCASAWTVRSRLFFYEIAMQDSDYYNLVQSRQVLINS